ncbi:MAG TPA: HD domain-containing phosphohydrolase [Pseudobdellovibrionaceae bacterium]|jgi:HD-GYP domain-containing protein (c-di-GMP phosphodiesterase class II)
MPKKPIDSQTDVLIASQRENFWQDVQIILKGFYPYKLHFVRSSESIINPTEEITPLLTLVDGFGGTPQTCEWVQSVKMAFPNCPLIVLYGPEDSLDFSLVKKNGANFIMHTNYDREFISDMILNLAPVEIQGTDLPTSALLPIDMKDIDPEEPINFDIFIHLPTNHKSFRVRKNGGKIDPRLLEKSSETHQRLYIKKTQIKPFFEYARTVLTMRNLLDPVPQTEKIYKSKKLIHEIISEFLDAEATNFQAGKVIFERCRQILNEFDLVKEKKNEDLVAEVYRFTGHSRSTYQDAISMAVFAASFAAMLGLDLQKIENAALAGLLHNLGLAQMPASATGKNLSELTAEELGEYKLYPDRSVILIKSKKVPLPPETSIAIVQHQENSDGSGFPHGLDSRRLDPLGKVLRLAMRFLELTSLMDDQPGMTPTAAIAQIKEECLSDKPWTDLVVTTQIFKKLGT